MTERKEDIFGKILDIANRNSDDNSDVVKKIEDVKNKNEMLQKLREVLEKK